MSTHRSPPSRVIFLVSTLAGCAASSTSQVPAQRATPAARVNHEPVTWTTVENPDARYIAALGMPTARGRSVKPEHLARARLLAARTLQGFDELQLAPADSDRAALLAESSRRSLHGVLFECGVTRHDVDQRGTHVAVNVAVVDLVSEAIVGSLTGRATAPGPANAEAQRLALEGALTTAMRGVPQLLAALDLPARKAERH